MRLGWREATSLQDRSDELVIKTEHLVQEFTVLDMVALLITIELHVVCH